MTQTEEFCCKEYIVFISLTVSVYTGRRWHYHTPENVLERIHKH